MKELKYIVGDVREPIGEGNKFVAHCVNSVGIMGSGVARALFEKWYKVRSDYLEWAKEEDFKLGNIQFVKVEKNIVVVNMVGQEGVGFDKRENPPIRYEAMRSCLQKLAEKALQYHASVNLPYKIGCDLAGGSWDIVEPMIIEELCAKDIEVIIYDIFNQRGV